MRQLSIFENTWLDVKDYEGYYQINGIGDVMNKKTGRILKPELIRDGYFRVELTKNGNGKKYLVHRLVYEAFYGNIPKGMEIDHVSTIPNDNRVENLRCVTPKENCNNPITKKRRDEANKKKAQDPKTIEATKRANSKPINQYSLDGQFEKTWASGADIKRELGYAYENISKCCRGIYEQAYGKIWRYKE